jgi:hypothetical protein
MDAEKSVRVRQWLHVLIVSSSSSSSSSGSSGSSAHTILVYSEYGVQ